MKISRVWAEVCWIFPIDNSFNSNGEKDRRFRLVHAQVIAPRDFARLGTLKLVAEAQPFHLRPAGGWFPEERISIQDAIRAYTLNTAYTNFEDEIKGSIRAGKLAGLTVLSANLLEITPAEILKTEVLYTIVGGKIVYSKSPIRN